MKRTLFALTFLFLFSTFFFSCQKYKDGPAFTLLSKKTRLKGTWVLKSIDGDATLSVNSDEGTVSTNCGTVVTYTNATVFTKYELEFEKDGDIDLSQASITKYVDYWATQTACTAIYTETDNSNFIKGDWEWEDGKEDIEITFNNYRTEYEILRLTKDELILETLTGEIWEFEKD